MWLTPDQVAILPISEKVNDYAKKVAAYFDKVGVRALIDDGLVSMRKQGGGEQATMTMEEFAKHINEEVAAQLETTKA